MILSRFRIVSGSILAVSSALLPRCRALQVRFFYNQSSRAVTSFGLCTADLHRSRIWVVGSQSKTYSFYLGWLVGWLVGCLVGWLVGWLVVWLVGWLEEGLPPGIQQDKAFNWKDPWISFGGTWVAVAGRLGDAVHCWLRSFQWRSPEVIMGRFWLGSESILRCQGDSGSILI